MRRFAIGIIVIVLVLAVFAVPASAHNDSCLVVVHAGGIQQHHVCS